MIEVETFSNELEILHTIKQLAELDDQVNQFIAINEVEGEGNTR